MPIARLKDRERLRFLTRWLISHLGATVIDDECELADLDGHRAFAEFSQAAQLAQLKLKTLDLLHLAYAMRLASKGLVKYFATLDGEILRRSGEIERMTGVVGEPSGATRGQA
jgi:hypothetical protein